MLHRTFVLFTMKLSKEDSSLVRWTIAQSKAGVVSINSSPIGLMVFKAMLSLNIPMKFVQRCWHNAPLLRTLYTAISTECTLSMQYWITTSFGSIAILSNVNDKQKIVWMHVSGSKRGNSITTNTQSIGNRASAQTNFHVCWCDKFVMSVLFRPFPCDFQPLYTSHQLKRIKIHSLQRTHTPAVSTLTFSSTQRITLCVIKCVVKWKWKIASNAI